MPRRGVYARQKEFVLSSHMVSDMTDAQQRAIFAALVAAQDEKLSVSESRAAVASKFKFTVEQVKDVEEMGLKKKWPPL